MPGLKKNLIGLNRSWNNEWGYKQVPQVLKMMASLIMLWSVKASLLNGLQTGKGVKIIMTTAWSDPRNVIKAHYHICNAYLIKPIDKAKLLGHLKSFGLI
jgi:hypothetical protein